MARSKKGEAKGRRGVEGEAKGARINSRIRVYKDGRPQLRDRGDAINWWWSGGEIRHTCPASRRPTTSYMPRRRQITGPLRLFGMFKVERRGPAAEGRKSTGDGRRSGTLNWSV